MIVKTTCDLIEQENMKKVNELTNSPPADDAPAARGVGGSPDMMDLLGSMVRCRHHEMPSYPRPPHIYFFSVGRLHSYTCCFLFRVIRAFCLGLYPSGSLTAEPDGAYVGLLVDMKHDEVSMLPSVRFIQHKYMRTSACVSILPMQSDTPGADENLRGIACRIPRLRTSGVPMDEQVNECAKFDQ